MAFLILALPLYALALLVMLLSLWVLVVALLRGWYLRATVLVALPTLLGLGGMRYATVAQRSGADSWPVHLLTIAMILAVCAFLVLVGMTALRLCSSRTAGPDEEGTQALDGGPGDVDR